MGKISKIIFRIMTAAFLMPLFFNSYILPQNLLPPVLLEKNILPAGKNFKCYISYRIPYDKLIFVQKNGAYQAGCSIEIEVTRNGKIISRKSGYKSAAVAGYDATRSKSDFLTGVISFEFDKSDYVLRPYLAIDNTSVTVPLDTLAVRLATGKTSAVVKPVVLAPSEAECGGKKVYSLVNQANNIPYSDKNYMLLIPLPENAGENISVKFERENKTAAEVKPEKILKGGFEIQDCENVPALINVSGDNSAEYALVNNFSYLLDEGNVTATVYSGDEKLESYNLQVAWIDKPASLRDPEYAVGKLRLIGAEQAADSILAKDSDEYYTALKKYWDKQNPGRKSKYNELMDEFYRRVDYCNRNFSTLNKMNGADSDRGKTFIRFGKPDEVKRSYSKENSVMEIWIYKNLNQEFVFTDDSGLGNYTLVK